MPSTQIWVHVVWGTKYRVPVLTDEWLSIICDHIRHNAQEKGIAIDCINGYLDHLHVLLRMDLHQCLAKILQLIKGEFNRWINAQFKLSQPFYWQRGYYAASVSVKDLGKVRSYIHHQQQRHQSQPYYQELERFCELAGLELLKEDADCVNS